MPNLISHLKKVAEQKPQATYYNVDMIKYQVNANPLYRSVVSVLGFPLTAMCFCVS